MFPGLPGLSRMAMRSAPEVAALEQLQPLRHCLLREVSHAGDVAARMREAGDEPAADRIGDVHHDDRDCRSRLSGSM